MIASSSFTTGDPPSTLGERERHGAGRPWAARRRRAPAARRPRENHVDAEHLLEREVTASATSLVAASL
jgi:hypothetical protein